VSEGREWKELRDAGLQMGIVGMLRLGPLSYRMMAGVMQKDLSLIAANCGELTAKGWIVGVLLQGVKQVELTEEGWRVAHAHFPSMQ